MKIYYDGALGSEGAWLSQPYYGKGENKGFTIMDVETLKGFMRQAWEIGLGIAVHAIGDQAAHEVSVAAVELWETGAQRAIALRARSNHKARYDSTS